jgi:hypothetical protein
MKDKYGEKLFDYDAYYDLCVENHIEFFPMIQIEKEISDEKSKNVSCRSDDEVFIHVMNTFKDHFIQKKSRDAIDINLRVLCDENVKLLNK